MQLVEIMLTGVIQKPSECQLIHYRFDPIKPLLGHVDVGKFLASDLEDVGGPGDDIDVYSQKF